MKPTRSRKYCQDCGAKKIHFETEEKALSFIRFNQDEIKEERGYSPVRAYYCLACGCWHVTSSEAFPYKSLTQKVLEAYRSIAKKKKHKLYASPRELGLTVVNDEKLKGIIEKNVEERELLLAKEEHRQKVHAIQLVLKRSIEIINRPIIKQQQVLDKQKRWLETTETQLIAYENRLKNWKKTIDLIKKCESMKRMIKNYPIDSEYEPIVNSYVDRLDHIVEEYNLVIDLIDRITSGLQDASSYLQSCMYSHVSYILKEVSKAQESLSAMNIEGLVDAAQYWQETLDFFKRKTEDILKE